MCCSHNVSDTHSVSIGSSLTFTSTFVTVCKISFASGLTDFFRMDNNEGSLLKVLDKCSERSHSAAANNSYEIFERYLLATQKKLTEILEIGHSISSGGHFMKYWGGGASARGLVRFICPCHGRGVRGHAPTGKF